MLFNFLFVTTLLSMWNEDKKVIYSTEMDVMNNLMYTLNNFHVFTL